MDKILQRLGQIEGMLITSRPVGGLPETAKDQLERFLVSRWSYVHIWSCDRNMGLSITGMYPIACIYLVLHYFYNWNPINTVIALH